LARALPPGGLIQEAYEQPHVWPEDGINERTSDLTMRRVT
jgi:hypothetical protein